MRKISVVALVLVLMFPLAQAQIKAPSKENIERFLKSKTYVVLEDNPFSVFNDFVSNQMKTIWKITPFEIISSEEFEKKMGDENSSFLFVSQAMFGSKKAVAANTKDEEGNEDAFNYTIINLVMGDASKNLNRMPDLCIVPVAYADVDEDTYEYKLAALIEFMAYYIDYVRANPGKDIQQVVKDNASELKNYELWFVEGDLATNVNTLAKIKQFYPYAVKIVTAEEIQKAIAEHNPKVAFLHKVGPEGTGSNGSSCWKFIMAAKDGKPLYFDNHQIGAGKGNAFLEDDFKNIAK